MLDYLAPQVGLEPTTLRLTAECSAIELLRSVLAGTSLDCSLYYRKPNPPRQKPPIPCIPAWGGEPSPNLDCVGFQTLLSRGVQWAASGAVTIPIPPDFPGPDSVSLRKLT